MYENIAIYAHGSTESSIDNQVSHVKDYLDFMPTSDNELYNQLVSEHGA